MASSATIVQVCKNINRNMMLELEVRKDIISSLVVTRKHYAEEHVYIQYICISSLEKHCKLR